MKLVLIAIASSLFMEGSAQYSTPDCPRPWVAEGDYCYLFSSNAKSWSDARIACENVDARLIAVTDAGKHFFVWQHLKKIVLSWERTLWYTGGRRLESSGTINPAFEWVGFGPLGSGQFWVDTNAAKTPNGDYIAYIYSDTFTHASNPGWFWVRADGVSRYPYICEVLKANSAKILSLGRDFDYGIYYSDPAKLSRGPYFVIEPQNIVASLDSATSDPNDKSDNSAMSLECEARGYPQPTYKWFFVTGQQEKEITSTSDYWITNGRLTIYKPLKSRDTGQYYCIATNSLGSIRSRSGDVSFIIINEFPREPITYSVRAYDYVVLPCKHNNQPNPQFRYHWYYNNDPGSFVSTDANAHVFISKNGNLYIGFTTGADANVYHCQIGVISNSGYMRSSPSYTLIVTGGDARSIEPVIDSPFPLIYPSSPLPKSGDLVNLECFARGTFRQGTSYDYTWSRDDGKPLPSSATLSDYSRLMTIPEVHPQDVGVYRCTVRYYGAQVSKTVELRIQMSPSFGEGTLNDLHADAGQRIAWPCVPVGEPKPTIQWLKNNKLLTNASGSVLLSSSMDELVISSVDSIKDSGMYQCAATNSLGTAYSSAQLRVLEFAPNFINRPMMGKMLATTDGNVTLSCDPDGAPAPTKVWMKDGVLLSLEGGTRLRRLSNGHLYISRIEGRDSGVYTCKATNRLGTANSSIEVTVQGFTQISYGPVKGVYVVNSTVKLHCRADYNRDFDLLYSWERNGVVIDFQDWRLSRIYERDMSENRGGLIIKRISFDESGYYRCIGSTNSDEAYKSAEIEVVGPPREPVGLEHSVQQEQLVQLRWQRGHDGGATIFAYIIELYNLDTTEWHFAKNVTEPNEVSLMNTTLDSTTLFADTSYTYRVLAQNVYGVGLPSKQSTSFRTLPSRPTLYPSNIGGGGGKVGTLVVTWDLLPKEKWNGPNLGYIVSYKHNSDAQYSFMPTVKHEHLVTGKQVILIHIRNFYTIYYVRVQAVNDKGQGPMPQPVPVYSAEDVPTIQPTETNVVAYNATAMLVYWNKVPNKVQDIRGKLIGFNIIYWPSGGSRSLALRRTIIGNVTEGLIIGLESDTKYNVEVQLFNSAGDSATGRTVEQKTWKKEPQTGPLYVKIEHLGEGNIKIIWQGIQTYTGEEPLDGYKVRIWKQGEHITNSELYEAGRLTWKVINNLRPEKGALYNVRVLGYSRGGMGKMSSPLVQFQFGCDLVYVNPEAEYIRLCSGCENQHKLLPVVMITVLIQLISNL